MVERPQHDTGHMSQFEALLWRLDADPRLSSTIANLTILDTTPDWRRLRTRLDRAAAAIPRLRQRIVETLGGLAPPRWIPDAGFDIDRHVRRVTLKGHRSQRAMLDMAMELFAEPLDRSRPLWDFVVIEGMVDGRAAMLQRLHHAVTDGIGGLRISEQFIDLERNAAEPPPIESPPTVDVPGFLDSVTETVAHLSRHQLDLLRQRSDRAREWLTNPGSLLGSTARGIDLIRSTARQARVTESRLSPLWRQRSLERRLDLIDVSLVAAKEGGRLLGGSVNDFFVTGVLAGAAEYHRRAGMPVEALRVAMPVSTRGSDRSAGGNLFAPTQTVLPAGDLSPTERFAQVHELLARTREEPAVGAVEPLAAALNLLPHPLLVWAGYRTSSAVDFVTSNIRAAPFDIYLAGALMEGNYPIGPLAGTAFNLTTMSYRGSLNMGLVTDTAAVEEPKLLASCIEGAYRELLVAAGL